MIKKNFKKIISLLAVVGLLLPILIQAQVDPEDPNGLLPGPAGYVPGQGQDELAQKRQQDSQPCQAEQSGGGGPGGIIPQANSLQNIFTQGFTKGMGQMFQDLFANRLPNIVKDILERRLQQEIQQRLAYDLPNLLNSRVRGELGRGQTPDQIRTALPTFLPQWLNEIMPQIVSAALSSTLQNGLRENLPPELVVDLQSQVPDIINNSNIPDQVAGIVATTTAVSSGSDPLNSGQRQDLTDETVNGIVREAQNGINHSDAVTALSEQIIPNIISQLAPQLLQQLMPAVNSSLGNFGSSGGYNNLANLSLENIFSGGAVGGIGGQFIGDLQLNQNFLNPLQQSLTGIAGNWGHSAALGVFALNPANVLPPPPILNQAMGNIGSGAAGQVVSNSSGIASGAVSNAGLGGLSNSLKTGIAGSLASGVGGLVSSLPGGQFLAPIVQEYVSQFTSTLFGISGGTPIGLATEGVVLANAPTITPTGGPGAGGIAQTGLANTIATEQGFMTSNQNTGQTAANTDAIKQTEQRIQNLTQQGCNEEKKARGEMESLTNLFYKLIPAALKARINATAEIYNKISEYFNKAYQVSPGARGIANTGTPGANNDGESVIAQPNQDIKDSNKEVLNKHVAQGQQNPNPNVKKAAQDAAQAAASVPEFVKQPLLTDQKRTALKDPEQRGNMSPEEYWDSIDRAAEDTRANAYLWLTGNVDNEQRLKNEVGLAQLVAGGGFRDIRECTEFINQQNADPNFVGPPTSAAQFCNPDKWKVKTPGSAVQSTWLKSLLAFWDFLTSSDVHQSDAIKAVADQPVIAIQDLSQPPQGAGSGQGPITPGQDPCPTTDPCPKSGWQPNQINTAGIENAISNSLNNQLDNLLNGGFGGDGDSSGGGSGFNPGDLAAIIGNVAASLPPPPPIQISFTQTKVDNIHSKLGWNAPAATFCKSGNNWVGSEPGIAAETPLGPNGNVTVTHQANATYEISCYNSANADQKQLRLQ